MRLPLLAAAMAVFATAASCNEDPSPERVMVPSSFAPITDEIDRHLERTGRLPPEWIIAGSPRLVSQLSDGADADVLITANRSWMDRAVEQDLVRATLGIVARNRLVFALAPSNPGAITSLEDLARPDLLLGVCAAEVPCGGLAADASEALEIEIAADTEEPNVLSLAQKISRGELDGGLVYATDAANFGLDSVDDERLAAFETEYPAAAINAERSTIVSFLASDAGRAILESAGFEVP